MQARYGLTSVAHFPDLEQHGEFVVARQEICGDKYVQLYKGVPARCEPLGVFRQGKRFLVNHVTGQRFGSVATMLAAYRTKGNGDA